jgi:hypothetical protein
MNAATPQLAAAFAALRVAIRAYPCARVEHRSDPIRALSGLECAAIHAPQNTGWLRQRRIELRKALRSFAPDSTGLTRAGELHRLYDHIVMMMHG